jgi:diguanylate cyclase (GGDEF)-like protein
MSPSGEEQTRPGASGPAGGSAGIFGRRRGRHAPGGDATAPDATVDPVTGVPGRQLLHEALDAAVTTSKRESAFAAIAFVHVARLRDINDSFGPDAGDEVLRTVAERLGSIDLPGTAVIRFPGAEFAVVFQGIPNANGAGEVARFLVELLAEPLPFRGDTLVLPAHVGLALSADEYDELGEMVHDAHEALVRARDQGTNTYIIHDESKRGRFTTRIDERRMADALANHEFLLLYQPIVDLARDEIVGAEALLRWAAPAATNVGILFPHDFLPLLEKTGLIVAVGRWVVEESCRQAAAWTGQFPGGDPPMITVNLSGRQLADPGFSRSVIDAIARHGLEPSQLCLDITDDTLRHHGEATWSGLRSLKEAGIRLGLDDFGRGEATLTRLRELRLDVLALDRAFMPGLEHNSEDRAIVRHTAALAHDLGCVALAEGVESAAQAEILADLGVDLGQGFHLGRPESAEDFTAHLASVAHDDTPAEGTGPSRF